MSETILTGELTDDQKEKSVAEKRDRDRYLILLELMLESYEQGEINFSQLCQWVVNISNNFNGDALDEMPELIRYQRVGEVIFKAISSRPLNVRATTPKELKSIIAKMVKFAKKDGYFLAQESEESAFEYISDHLKKMGVNLSTRTIQTYWNSQIK